MDLHNRCGYGTMVMDATSTYEAVPLEVKHADFGISHIYETHAPSKSVLNSSHQTNWRPKDFTCTIPGCASWSWCKTLACKVGGTTIQIPYSIQPCCADSYNLRCQTGFRSSSSQELGHPFCTNWSTFDNTGWVAVSALIMDALTGEDCRFSNNRTVSGGVGNSHGHSGSGNQLKVSAFACAEEHLYCTVYS